MTGEFTRDREIRLIDLVGPRPITQHFDAASHRELFVLRFLQKFIHDITLPVELDGREHIDYVPTQVFTEYFRYAFPGGVDGLMFPSAQGPGNNVAVSLVQACVRIGETKPSTPGSAWTRARCKSAE